MNFFNFVKEIRDKNRSFDLIDKYTVTFEGRNNSPRIPLNLIDSWNTFELTRVFP
jgi:hypothetical protein